MDATADSPAAQIHHAAGHSNSAGIRDAAPVKSR
jgi:hypothetical protein